ncbi:MBL fold metallo-hydrolase [Bradyrhizobium uaiense]|uniref:MBL fold metallo-hydrolase n=1 Tax=Bradyrhizobium uaiense TaxID=2594946 RepID=A0A6P1BNB0_9BRAD|nr:MBL fold metallo-hydrolase [Bradyrhizobium uaiense]
MRRIFVAVTAAMTFATLPSTARATPCLVVTLTGTQGGPTVFNGQAGAGTLVSYGDDSNGCAAVRLQFDAGRGTSMRLSQVKVTPVQLSAIFLTHIHGDHTEGLPDVLALRWYLKGSKVDVVCSADTVTRSGSVNSCRNYVTHIADAFIRSGEVAERLSEDRERLAGGPAELANVLTFEPKEEPQLVWASGDVKVSAVRSTHIAGHASYRVDTPAGSVVIGGDASNDTPAPPRSHSTSDQVEKLAQGTDVIVHSAIHPVLGPDRGQRLPRADLLSAERSHRPWRNGKASGREVLDVDSSCSLARHCTTQSLGRARRPSHGSRLPQGR